jgi:outer membrane protein assembly factor BamB
MDGRVYYNVNTYPKVGWYALSLYTGEVLYFHETKGPATGAGGGFNSAGSIAGDALAFGQIYNYGSPNQHGGFDYLWSTTYYNESMGVNQANTWVMMDGYTGQFICTLANVTQTEVRGTARITTGATGTAVYGQDGSILRYNIVNLGSAASPQRFLQVWNTSTAIMAPAFRSTAANAYWMWRPTLNYTFDGREGFSLNASIPDVQGSIAQVREGKYVIGNLNGKVNDTYTQLGNMWALNLDPSKGALGSLLWNITYAPPKNVPDVAAGSGFGAAGVSAPIIDPEDGVFIFNNRITLTWYGYSLTTGQQLWGPTQPEGDMNFYGMYSNIYNGKLLSTGYSGVLMCYDIKTGQVLWNYTAQQIGSESPYGNFPMYITAISDGKIYVVSGEHSPTQPLWRGSYIRCIDANTGTEVWKILHWGSGIGGAHLTGTAVYAADGNVVGLNLYDNQIYCYGKGPSTTTVNIQSDVVSLGQSVLITGTVMDTSPGAEKKIATGEVAAMPAISDQDQEAWMEFVYADQVKPMNAKGVPVSIDTLDPNGNQVHIADVVSDASGGFKYLWKPEIPGEFTVTAKFSGSKAFYESQATTYLGVTSATPAPVVTPTPPTPPPTATQPPVTPVSPTPVPTPVSPSPSEAPEPPTSGMPVETYIAIGAAVIVIVAVAAALVLRRRK